MKTEQFIQRLNLLPATASNDEIKDLKLFIERYPWFGIARQLLLEALHQNNDERFSDYIPMTAMYVVHREQLHYRMQQFVIQLDEQKEKITLLPDEDIVLIEEESMVQAPKELIPPPPPPPSPPVVIKRPKQILTVTPSDYFAGDEVVINAETDFIARFIVERPKIRPLSSSLMGVELPNQIEQSPPPKKYEDIVSETLARVYEDQGLISLAQATYEKLSLLEPKKSAYFAARIQNLKFKPKS
jgi:hypothetical protein